MPDQGGGARSNDGHASGAAIAAIKGANAERAVVVVLVIACGLMTIGSPFVQAWLSDPDQLTVPGFVEDLLRNPHFSLLTWNVPTAPYAFPDLPVLLALRFVTGDPYLTVWLHALLYVGVLIAAAGFVIRRAVPEPAQARWALIAFLALATATLGIAHRVSAGMMMLAPFESIAHGTAAISALVMFCLYDAWLERRNVLLHLVLIGLSTACVFSDKFFLALFAMPFTATLVMTASRQRKDRRAELVRVLLFAAQMAVAAAIVLWLSRPLLQQFHSFGFRPINRLRNIATLVINEGSWPWVIWALGLIAALVVLLAARPGRPTGETLSQRRARTFIYNFTLFGTAVAVFLWFTPSILLGRYAVGLELGGLIAGAILLSDHAGGVTIRTTATATLCLVALIAVLSMPSTNPFRLFAERRELAATMLACRERFDLKSGFAEYGYARKINLATGWRMQMLQFATTSPRLFFWGSNLVWFYDEFESGGPVETNFIIANGYEIADIQGLYGAPSREADCGSFHLLLYDDGSRLLAAAHQRSPVQAWAYAIADRLPPGTIDASSSDGVNLDPLSFFSETGHIEGATAVAQAPADRAGELLRGPSFALAPGSYAFDLTMRCSAGTSASMVYVESTLGRLATLPQAPNNGGCDGLAKPFTLKFRTDRRAADVNLVAMFGGSGVFELGAIRFRRLAQ